MNALSNPGRTKSRRVLRLFLLCVLAVYFILRFFVIAPILSGTDFSRAYYDRNGKLLRLTLTEDEKYRMFVPLRGISDGVKKATVLYEDKYFYAHPGVNPISLARAAARYVTGRGREIGASTLTMQVARLRYHLNTKTIGGKLTQIAAAIWMDLFHSKDEILEAYLNLAPYGGNIEGIGAASLIYFNTHAAALSQIESITLSTIPQNPTKRGLATPSGLSTLMAMRHDLVRRWVAAEPDPSGKLMTLADMPLSVGKSSDLPFYAPHFIDAQEAARQNDWGRFERCDSEITTTLDLGLQKKLEGILSAEITKRRDTGVQNAAAILLNYRTMEVLSYIGSADYFDKSILGQNDGVTARRSPGSTLKPFIYATAVDMGFIHSMTLLKDAKVNFGVYAPENSDSEFFGPVLARDALVNSRNIPAIALVRKIGVENFYKFMATLGVAGLKDSDHYGISIALGGAEVSMLELAKMYAMMANLGNVQEIRMTMNQDKGASFQVLSPEAFFIVLDMLSSQGSLDRVIPFAKQSSTALHHYWKTGTSSAYRDAWTAGIFGDYVLIVWVGNFDGTPNNAFSGLKTAAPLYFALARGIADTMASRGKPISNANFWTPELNLSRVEMCDKVGGLAGTYCPKVVSAYFIPGKSPIETSSVYRAIPIDKKTGLRACVFDPKTTTMGVYEFWEPEYLDMFKRAGIRRKTPPPFMPGCDLSAVAAFATPPVIVSPIDRTKIVIVSGFDTERVTFKALTDSDTAKIFWFLNDAMLGTTTSGQVLEHAIPMGEYTLRAVSESGTATEIRFVVVK